jgi:hypothetical protein
MRFDDAAPAAALAATPAASAPAERLALPDKPSIAVLPFRQLGTSIEGTKLIRHQLPLGSSPAVWLDRIVPNGTPDWRMSYCNLGSGAVVRPSLRPD